MAQNNEYANAILSTYKPSDSSTIIKHRLNSAEVLNEEISEWFRERAKIEDSYANALERLSERKLSQIPHSGIFEGVWNSLIKQTRETSKASSGLSHKITTDIEQPLRSFCTHSEQWPSIIGFSENLDTLAHTFSNNDEKVEKLRKKTQTSRHHQLVENAQHSLDELRSQWESQAPFILEQIEIIDKARLGFLKNSLINFETLEADKSQRLMKNTESVLNTILSFEPMDEVAAFAAQAGRNLERPSTHNNIHNSRAERGSISELSEVITNNTPSMYEAPQSPASTKKDDSTAGFKLKSKVGSIFRSSKIKNKFSGSLSISNHSHEPSRVENVHSASNNRDIERNSLVENNSNVAPVFVKGSKPPPPPSRKLNGGSLSVATQKVDDVPAIDISRAEETNNISESLPVTYHVKVPSPSDYAIPENITDTVSQGSGNKHEDDVAISSITSQLRARPTVSRRGQRGRRDIQSTLFTGISSSDIESSATPTTDINASLDGIESFSSPRITDDVLELPENDLNEAPKFMGITSVNDAPELSLLPILQPSFPEISGFKASITEQLSATIVDGEVERAQLVGEICLLNDGVETPSNINLKLCNFKIFDKIVPNYRFLESVDFDTFKLDTAPILGTTGAMGYKLLSQNAKAFVPVDFTPVWRVEQEKSRLMLTYKVANPYLTESPVILQNVVITVSVEGGKAIAAHSKPKVVFSQTKQSVIWKFDKLVVKAGVEEKLLCQFDTEGPAFESRQGIDVKFTLVQLNTTPRDVGTVIGDESELHRILLYYGMGEPSENSQGYWKPLPTTVSLSSGKLTLHSEKNVQVQH